MPLLERLYYRSQHLLLPLPNLVHVAKIVATPVTEMKKQWLEVLLAPQVGNSSQGASLLLVSKERPRDLWQGVGT